jgi:hypothetical protein
MNPTMIRVIAWVLFAVVLVVIVMRRRGKTTE